MSIGLCINLALGNASSGSKLSITGWWGMVVQKINPYWVGLKSQWIIETRLWIIKADLVVFHIRVEVTLIAVVVFNLVISIWMPWRLHGRKSMFFCRSYLQPTENEHKLTSAHKHTTISPCKHARSKVSIHSAVKHTVYAEFRVPREKQRVPVCCYSQPTLTSKQSVKENFHIKIELHLQKQPTVIASRSSAGITIWVSHCVEFWSSRLQLRGKCCLWSWRTEQPEIKRMEFCFGLDFPLKG